MSSGDDRVSGRSPSDALAKVSGRSQVYPTPLQQLAIKGVHLSGAVIAGCDKPSLNDLCTVMPRIAVSWYELGLRLGAKDFTLKLIEKSHKDDPEQCCREMLQNWLNGKQDCGDCSRTWNDLLSVVQMVVGSETNVFIKMNVLNWKEVGEPMDQETAESCKAVVLAASPEYDVEMNDCHYLRKATKKALRNEKLDSCKLIKALYVNTYVLVADILERNEQHSRKMVRAARTTIELKLAEGNVRALTATLTVAELLEQLYISERWDETDLLERMVYCLPEGARTLAMSLLGRYDMLLEVYNNAVLLKDSLGTIKAPEVTNAQLPVEVTLSKNLTEFTRMDCKEMLGLLLCKTFEIPQYRITVTDAQSGHSTTVVCIIDKAFVQNLFQYLITGSVLWAFKELSITRMQIGLFEVNVSQLLSQHFKDALRNGLTSGMDFVGATKILPYQVYALADLDISEQLLVRTIHHTINRPWTEQEEAVPSTDEDVEMETTAETPDDAVVSPESDDASCDELLSVIPEPEEKIKDLERKTTNLFMHNVALTTKLKASRAVEEELEERIRNLEERLVQSLKEQEAASQELSLYKTEKSILENKIKMLERIKSDLQMGSEFEDKMKVQVWKEDGEGVVSDEAVDTASTLEYKSKKPELSKWAHQHRWWLKVLVESHDVTLPMDQAEGSFEMEGEVRFKRDTKTNMTRAISGTEWMYKNRALERSRWAVSLANRLHRFAHYHQQWLADYVRQDDQESCNQWLLHQSPEMTTVMEAEKYRPGRVRHRYSTRVGLSAKQSHVGGPPPSTDVSEECPILLQVDQSPQPHSQAEPLLRLHDPPSVLEPHTDLQGMLCENVNYNIERSQPGSIPVDVASPTQATPPSTRASHSTPLRTSSSMSESMTPISPVVRVIGIKPYWDEDMLSMAFDDEDEDGGEIEENGIQIKGNEALITFKDPDIAQRVSLKETWEVCGVLVQVLPFQRKRDAVQAIVEKCTPDNTIVIEDIPEGINEEYLKLYLETVTKLDEDDFTVEQKGMKALMVLQGDDAADHLEAMVAKIQSAKKLLKGTRLKANRLTPVQAVLVTSISNEACRKDKLKLYFKNKKKSGGGKLQDVKITAKGQAVVTFQEPEGVVGALARNHAGQLGEEVELQAYHPILTLWSGAVAQLQRVNSKKKAAITHKLSKAQYEHIRKCNLMQVVNDQLADIKLSAEAKLDTAETAVCIEPTAGSEYDEEWSSLCSDVLQEVLGSISVASVNIPEDVSAKVFPVILANVTHPNVTITLSNNHDHLLITGSQQDADQLREKVENIISNNLDTMQEIQLPVSVLVFADQCIRQTLEKDNPHVFFKVSLPDGKMHISGKAAGCEKFVAEIENLRPVKVVPKLPVEAVQLLSVPNGKQLLLSKLPHGEAVSYYFTAEDGTIPSDDVTPMHALHIVGCTMLKVRGVVDELQKCIAVIDIPVPKEFENTQRMEIWSEMKRSIEKQYIALLIPVVQKRQIQLVCDTTNVSIIKREIQSFIGRECLAEECIPVERGQWDYMQEHSKEWRRESYKIEEAGIEYKFPKIEEQVLTFRLKGETTPVRMHSAVIKDILGHIVKDKVEVARPGTVKHFLSDNGALQLTGIGTKYKAVIEVATKEEEEEEAVLIEKVAKPTHRTVCSGVIAGGKKVEIMVGDLTEYPVDVIVNPANTKLQHGGGLAGLISRKGGDIIQQESAQYIERHGPLDVGEAVLLKRVGNLRCKAVVHAVGPIWRNGKQNEEAYLAKAVEESLSAAQNYRTIGLPAISSGIYGVPLDVCAQAMFKGISMLFQKNPQCNIKVIIMLHQDSHVGPFDKAVDQFLQNVSRPQRPSSPVSPVSKRMPVQKELPMQSKRSPPTGPKRPVLPAPSKLADAIVLQKGSLTDHTADVYVNTAASTLDLRHGAVANSLQKVGGPKLQEECTQYTQVNGDVDIWEFATTGGHKLKCKHVIHTVGNNYDGPGGMAEKGMKTMIYKVMEECDRLKASSVAIPALGTGNLGFPDSIVAGVMVNTISDYLEQQKGKTALKKVILVIFLDKTYDAFQKAVKRGVVAPHLPVPGHQVQPSPRLVSDEEEYEFVTVPPRVQHKESTMMPAFQCNSIAIDIVHGDISEDDCEGLVNTTSEDLTLHNFGIQRALLQKGGQSLQDECKAAVMEHGGLTRQGKVIVTGPGRVGGLKCRKILHVIAPRQAGGLVRTVGTALEKADEEGLRSVALPAIGTGQHGFSAKQAAKNICEAIVTFSKSNHTALNHIRIVLFEQNLFSEFSKHFEESGKEKGVFRTIVGALGGLFRAVTSAFAGNIPYDQEHDSGRDSKHTVAGPMYPPGLGPLKRVHSYSEETVLVISVYAGSQQIALAVVAHINRTIDESFITDQVSHAKIDELSLAVEQNLQHFAKQLHVKLNIERAPFNEIKIRGDKVDVGTIKTAVMERLFKLEMKEKRKTEAELLSSTVRWQWKDTQGRFQYYEPLVNLLIEEAHREGSTTVVVGTNDGPKDVDIANMKESGQQHPVTMTEVRRIDLEQERQEYERMKKEGERPASWEQMPIDPNTGKEATHTEVPYMAVDILPGSTEFTIVENHFTTSMGGIGSFIRGMQYPYRGIVKIQRIQNPVLYGQYNTRKKAMVKVNPGNVENERQLFHGCPGDVTENINSSGFNRSFRGKNATYFGEGMYFAKDARYSARDTYTPRDASGYKYTYLAKVLTGEYTKGYKGMIEPPAKDPKIKTAKFDSTVDDVDDPTIFVVYYDGQAYPEYLITYN